MAKKYQAIETKVHWLTWTAIIAVVVALVSLVILIQPSKEEVFYNTYYGIATEYDFKKKLPRDNKYIIVDRLEDGFLGINKGVFSFGERNDKLTIVFVSHPSIENGSTTLSNVYARLYGSSEVKPSIEASNLYKELGDEKIDLLYYELSSDKVDEFVDQIKNRYDNKFASETIPMLLVLFDGKLVDYAVLTSSNIPLQLIQFYDSVLDNKLIASLK